MEKPIDNMTGLIAGSELYPEMDALIAKNAEFALVFIDIDMLFALNRDYGHAAGDAVILTVAKYARKYFPEPCMAFRDTRDEFIMLVPGGGKEEAFLKAEQLRRSVCEEKLDFTSEDGRPLTQSVSVGVASYPEDGSRPADVYRRADSAMIRAKKSGRNTVCLAREEKLSPKTSHYTQAQLEKLSIVSENLNVGEAALLREALDDLLKKYDVDEVMKKHIN